MLKIITYHHGQGFSVRAQDPELCLIHQVKRLCNRQLFRPLPEEQMITVMRTDTPFFIQDFQMQKQILLQPETRAAEGVSGPEN